MFRPFHNRSSCSIALLNFSPGRPEVKLQWPSWKQATWWSASLAMSVLLWLAFGFLVMPLRASNFHYPLTQSTLCLWVPLSTSSGNGRHCITSPKVSILPAWVQGRYQCCFLFVHKEKSQMDISVVVALIMPLLLQLVMGLRTQPLPLPLSRNMQTLRDLIKCNRSSVSSPDMEFSWYQMY